MMLDKFPKFYLYWKIFIYTPKKINKLHPGNHKEIEIHTQIPNRENNESQIENLKSRKRKWLIEYKGISLRFTADFSLEKHIPEDNGMTYS